MEISLSFKASDSLWQIWLATEKKSPNQIALVEVETEKTWTRAKLTKAVEEKCSQFDSNLKGEIVAFCIRNSPQWLITFLAIQKLQGIALPLDSALSAEAQIHTAQQLHAHWVVQNDGALRRIGTSKPLSFSACCIKTTSGTTGMLKPIFCKASHLLFDGIHILRTMKIKPTDRHLSLIPLGHSYGLGNLVMPLLLQGSSIVCISHFVPHQITSLIRKYQVTVLPSVPAIYKLMNQLEPLTKLPSLRLAISAGAPLSAEIATTFYQRYGVMIHNFYGSSETGGICYDRTGKASLTGRSVGKPLFGVTVQVKKNRHVIVRSRAVASGQSSGSHTSFQLADLGEWNRYGELRLIGRAGTIANIGGKKVHPSEVENFLRKLKGISDCWVTVSQDQRGSDYLAAAIESSKKQFEIESELAQMLPAWKFPKRYFIRPSLPRTQRGKLNIPLLKQWMNVEG